MRSNIPEVPPPVSRSGLRLAARRLRLRYWFAGFALALWLLDLWTQIGAAQTYVMADALSYAAAGRHLLEGELLYAPFQLAGPYGLGAANLGQGFVYPPTAALLFVPLSPLGSEGLAVVFGAALAAFGLLAFRLARRSGLGSHASALLAFAVTFSGPAISGASSGNVNLLVADALLASWLWPGSAGTFAVLGGAIKVFPAAGLVWTARQRRSLGWPVALAVALLVAATLMAGFASWADFLTAFENGRSSSAYYVVAPVELLGPGLGQVVGYGLALAALAGAWRMRDEAAAFALLGWAMILPAPDWYSHYLAIPLAAALPWAARALAAYRTRRPMGWRSIPSGDM